jgi:hypothetical protein
VLKGYYDQDDKTSVKVGTVNAIENGPKDISPVDFSTMPLPGDVGGNDSDKFSDEPSESEWNSGAYRGYGDIDTEETQKKQKS